MNKKEFIRAVTDVLRENNVRKPISVPKQTFHISDDDGNVRDFTVKRVDKTAIYTVDDVTAIVDASLYVIKQCIRKGETIFFYGIGSLGLHYRKPRITKHVATGEDAFVPGKYVPKFTFGNELRREATLYEMSLEDRFGGIAEDDDDDDEELS